HHEPIPMGRSQAPEPTQSACVLGVERMGTRQPRHLLPLDREPARVVGAVVQLPTSQSLYLARDVIAVTEDDDVRLVREGGRAPGGDGAQRQRETSGMWGSWAHGRRQRRRWKAACRGVDSSSLHRRSPKEAPMSLSLTRRQFVKAVAATTLGATVPA